MYIYLYVVTSHCHRAQHIHRNPSLLFAQTKFAAQPLTTVSYVRFMRISKCVCGAFFFKCYFLQPFQHVQNHSGCDDDDVDDYDDRTAIEAVTYRIVIANKILYGQQAIRPTPSQNLLVRVRPSVSWCLLSIVLCVVVVAFCRQTNTTSNTKRSLSYIVLFVFNY